ncbi:MAG: UbiA family prenyltransferase [candidate division WOR-3 bacterium]
MRKGNLFDAVFLTRPMIMVPGWIFMFMGYFWAKGLPLFGLSIPLDPMFWIAFVSYSLEMGAVYILNQITDLESDRENRKLLILPEGLLSVRFAWAEAGVLGAVSLILAFLVGLPFVIIWFLSGLLGFLYSGPPNLKAQPIPNIILNMVGYGFLAVLAGWAVGGKFSWLALLFCLPYAFGDGAVTAATMIPDIPGDRRAGEETLAVRYGPKATAWFAFACDILALTTGLIARDPIISLAAGLSAPLFLYSAIRTNDLSVKLSFRVSSFILALLVGLRFPSLIALGLAVLLGSKLYYRLRFGIRDYPSLTGR